MLSFYAIIIFERIGIFGMFEFWDILFNLLLAFSFFGGIKNINNKFKKKLGYIVLVVFVLFTTRRVIF